MKKFYESFIAEAKAKSNMKAITGYVLTRQRQRRFCFSALKQGKLNSWDYRVPHDSRDKYIRSHMGLGDLEHRARYPDVDAHGYTKMLGKLSYYQH